MLDPLSNCIKHVCYISLPRLCAIRIDELQFDVCYLNLEDLES